MSGRNLLVGSTQPLGDFLLRQKVSYYRFGETIQIYADEMVAAYLEDQTCQVNVRAERSRKAAKRRALVVGDQLFIYNVIEYLRYKLLFNDGELGELSKKLPDLLKIRERPFKDPDELVKESRPKPVQDEGTQT